MMIRGNPQIVASGGGYSLLLPLETKSAQAEAERIVTEIVNAKEGQLFNVEVKKYFPKRSLNANSYMWQLCQQIAVVMNITKEEVYRKHLRDTGNFQLVPIKTEAVSKFVQMWTSYGVGWVAIPMETKGAWTMIHAYPGSSTYDSKEMSRLIDSVVEEAKTLGIETITPEQIEIMKGDWGKSAKG